MTTAAKISFEDVQRRIDTQPHLGFAFIQFQKSDKLLFVQGEVGDCSVLKEIPRWQDRKNSYDSLSIVPFAQAAEKGYKVRAGNETVRSMTISFSGEISISDFLEKITPIEVELAEGLHFKPDQAGYETAVQSIVENEIGNGEGANFLIKRSGFGTIRQFSVIKALSMFTKLLSSDYGSYWKFIFFDTKRVFLGSTPERHVTVSNGNVVMNPISGTFRKDLPKYSVEHYYQAMCDFLRNPKEINELFMVLDEELKMMARICSMGGEVQGPYLKEMSKLIHTEYELAGKSDKDLIDIVRETMFAATMTGSPLENAFNIIYEYETEPRAYYSSALLLIGHDDRGEEWIDSPILIRTLDIGLDGKFVASVGASLVRDSKPHEEFLETESKIAGVLNSLIKGSSEATPPLISKFTEVQNSKIQALLFSRNASLSHFWTDPQYGKVLDSFNRLKVTIIDNEDDFTWMSKHIFTRLGCQVEIARHSDFAPDKFPADLYLVGPGPGNPNDPTEKMVRNIRWIRSFLEQKKPFLAICLGHQLLSYTLGFPVRRKPEPSQGVQKKISFFGLPEYVGFYNTFVPVLEKPMPGIEVALDDNQKDILAIRGPHFASFQFHPESVLTQRGVDILRESIEWAIRANQKN